MSKTAVITGATSGLGLAYAKYFAAKGYDLVITGRRREILEQNAVDLHNKYAVDVKSVVVDLAEEKGIDLLLSKLEGITIDVLVNNAGFGLKPCFADNDIDDIGRMICLQTLCVSKLTHFALQGMKERNEGTIINISSDGAFAVIPHNVLYSSTKLFITNLTEGLYLELKDTGIKVQVVCPGFIDSHFHESAKMKVDKENSKFGKFRKPDDVVNDAMKDFYKGKVVSVPDKGARMIKRMAKLLPRPLFYRVALKASYAFKSKKGKA